MQFPDSGVSPPRHMPRRIPTSSPWRRGEARGTMPRQRLRVSFTLKLNEGPPGVGRFFFGVPMNPVPDEAVVHAGQISTKFH
jgi:hypothetical protein